MVNSFSFDSSADKKITVSTPLAQNDLIKHNLHRHEPPILVPEDPPIEIIAQTDDLLVVNKPASIPVS